MKLDFTQQGKIELKHVRLYNKIAEEVRVSFTGWTEKIYQEYAHELDWWMFGSIIRETHVSPLFHYCTLLAFLKHLVLQKEPISAIIVDSGALKRVVEQYLITHQLLNIKVIFHKKKIARRFHQILKNLYQFIVVPRSELKQLLQAKRTFHNSPSLSKKNITLIDYFVVRHFSETNDTYYPGLLDTLTEEEKQSIYFVPTLYGVSAEKYFETFQQMRLSKRNFLIKQDFLKLSDYF
ncbi:MAG: hypothetical protein HQM14_19800, partial [SAR324 cluster bacterium]|nr:hypothetical protein [SAR324 cluster bacterium]